MLEVMGDALPPADQAVATGDWASRELGGIKRALEHGFDGWVDDDLAFTRPWGFNVADIRVPVHIWQGEADRLVPWSHGQWLADRIPGAQFTLAEGQGHFSLGDREERSDPRRADRSGGLTLWLTSRWSTGCSIPILRSDGRSCAT